MRARSIALGALAVAALTVPAAAQEAVNVRRAASATGPMEVNVMSGEVRLVGWGRNEVQITGRLARNAERLEVSTAGERLLVRVIHTRGHGSDGGSDLEIHYPARRMLQIQTVSADVAVEGPGHEVHASTVSGGVEVRGNPTELDVNTRSGDILLDGSTARLKANSISGGVQVRGAVRNDAQVNTVSGDIVLGGAVGSLSVHSVSGDIRASSVSNSAEAQTVSGNIEIAARSLTGEYSTVSGGIRLSGRPVAGRTLELHSHSGEVELRLPRGVDADLELTTWSGEMDVQVAGARVTQSSRREREVRLGRGGPHVELSTFSGSVRVVDQ